MQNGWKEAVYPVLPALRPSTVIVVDPLDLQRRYGERFLSYNGRDFRLIVRYIQRARCF